MLCIKHLSTSILPCIKVTSIIVERKNLAAVIISVAASLTREMSRIFQGNKCLTVFALQKIDTHAINEVGSRDKILVNVILRMPPACLCWATLINY